MVIIGFLATKGFAQDNESLEQFAETENTGAQGMAAGARVDILINLCKLMLGNLLTLCCLFRITLILQSTNSKLRPIPNLVQPLNFRFKRGVNPDFLKFIDRCNF